MTHFQYYLLVYILRKTHNVILYCITLDVVMSAKWQQCMYLRMRRRRAAKCCFCCRWGQAPPDCQTHKCQWCPTWRPRNMVSNLGRRLRLWLWPVWARSSDRSCPPWASSSASIPGDRLSPRSNWTDLYLYRRDGYTDSFIRKKK